MQVNNVTGCVSPGVLGGGFSTCVTLKAGYPVILEPSFSRKETEHTKVVRCPWRGWESYAVDTSWFICRVVIG